MMLHLTIKDDNYMMQVHFKSVYWFSEIFKKKLNSEQMIMKDHLEHNKQIILKCSYSLSTIHLVMVASKTA